MKLHANPIAALAVTGITANSLNIAQTVYTGSVQVGQQLGAGAWGVKQLQEVSEADVRAWADLAPELVVLGTGAQHRFLNPKLAVALAQRGVGLECMNTGAAARTYNVLLEEGRNLVGAFIIEPSLKG